MYDFVKFAGKPQAVSDVRIEKIEKQSIDLTLKRGDKVVIGSGDDDTLQQFMLCRG